MMIQKGKNIIAFVFVVGLAFGGFACKQGATAGNQTAATDAASGITASSPTDAYKMLFAAVRAKDSAQIKASMSKATLAMASGAAQRFGKTLEKQIENGMQETTITDTLPEMRDERVKDNYGALEVFNKKTGRWDETIFVKEDGGWKLALGEALAGTYKSPGKSRSETEAATNPSANTMTEIKPNMSGALPSANTKIPASGNVNTVQVPLEKPEKKSADANKGGAKQ